ncbi:hypothetical protein [Ruegeria sp. A3M17]|uniref:hypothetical protein n=1 Tax=Ruegeria sp. A3M17 TaxID=2267229 RepID=UPI000DEB425A|nr:hypothetical protein [Ruegeria sp. A3M17]RBW53153.1 hypothetical protein DS906_19520 [Ruegeria sp. A3M17]
MKAIFGAVATLFFAVQCTTGTANAEDGVKLKLIVVSDWQKDQLDAFYKIVSRKSPSIDPNSRPDQFAHADVAVVILDEWKDVDQLVEDPRGPIWQKIRNSPPNVTRFRLVLEKKTGGTTEFILFSRDGPGDETLICYADT